MKIGDKVLYKPEWNTFAWCSGTVVGFIPEGKHVPIVIVRIEEGNVWLELQEEQGRPVTFSEHSLIVL